MLRFEEVTDERTREAVFKGLTEMTACPQDQQKKSIQQIRKDLEEEHLRGMQDRMDRVTGISKDLRRTILKEFKPDEQLEDYYRRRLQTLNEKYGDASTSEALVGGTNRRVKRILRSGAQRLTVPGRSSSTLANMAQMQYNQI